jgi:DnaJ-domain-containing protein 1
MDLFHMGRGGEKIMARRTDAEIAEAIVEDVRENGPGSAQEIADSIGISRARFYAVMARQVNLAAERRYPGFRVMPRSGDHAYALLRKYRSCDPSTVHRRAKQAATKNHRLAMELDVADAGLLQQRIQQKAQALAVQYDLFVADVADWVTLGEAG